MNTSDMHPFIHPLSAAVDPAREAKSDWEIYKAIAKKFSEVCVSIWVKKPTSSRCLSSMTLPLNWRSRWM